MRKASPATKNEIEKLLTQQTDAILRAVDERLGMQEVALISRMEKQFERSDRSFSAKLEKLMTTLDRFLKRLTDFEDEFEILKREVSRMKAAIRDKFGVTID